MPSLLARMRLSQRVALSFYSSSKKVNRAGGDLSADSDPELSQGVMVEEELRRNMYPLPEFKVGGCKSSPLNFSGTKSDPDNLLLEGESLRSDASFVPDIEANLLLFM